MKKLNKNQNGFSLIECMVAMVVTIIGLTAVAGLIAEGIKMQSYASKSMTANAFAKAKIEQLKNFPVSSAQRQAGGSLTVNTAGYNDQTDDAQFTRRWLIESTGVPAGTQKVTVTIVPNMAGGSVNSVSVQILLPTT
jgi:prepilin-type N-terminal cleavage/methylation domain-containing protein